MNGKILLHIKNYHKYLKHKKYFEDLVLYPIKNTERLHVDFFIFNYIYTLV